MSRAFARINALIAIVAGMSLVEQQLAFQGYKSRGHGKNKYTGKKRANSSTPFLAMGRINGKRECDRRVRQQKAREAKWAKELERVQAS